MLKMIMCYLLCFFFTFHRIAIRNRMQSNNSGANNNQMIGNTDANNANNATLNLGNNLCQSQSNNIDITLSNTVHELNVLTSVLNSQMQMAVQQQQQVHFLFLIIHNHYYNYYYDY